MSAPSVYLPKDVVRMASSVLEQRLGCGWHPARPLGLQGWFVWHRVTLAWRVFTGRYDALDWGDR